MTQLGEHEGGVRSALARELGCDVSAFDGNMLTLVPQPDPSSAPGRAMICTFGTGTVISIDPAYLEWARANAPERHYRTFYLVFLNPFLAEGVRRGDPLVAQTANLCFALHRLESPIAPPAGVSVGQVAPSWMDEWQRRGGFSNALDHDRQRFAIVASAESGEPAAIAGVFDTWGMLEIGVDVAREYRGRGLATVVVRAAAQAIVEAGRTPFYSCAATNIRSQRTALASGFLPACSLAYVAPERP